MKILLTGGGTGGHIMPILAVVDKLKKLDKDCNEAPQPCGTMEPTNLDFLFIGPKSNFNKVITDEGIKVKTISAGKLRRYISIENLFDTIKIPIGIIQSLGVIYNYKPDIVFSKGGFASVPPVIAAWIFKIPIITHESDIVPGLANKIISKFAKKILISFSVSEKYFSKKKVVFTGNPIRQDILDGNKNRARNTFDLKEEIPTILIFGGSQGARRINEVIIKSLPDILEKFQMIHICGNKNYKNIKQEVQNLDLKNNHRYKLHPFLTNDLKDSFALCDVIISRAGANSLSEIIALEKMSIIIPLSTSANNHQLLNAEYFAKKEMTIMIKEKNLTSEKLTEETLTLLSNNEVGDKIIKNIKKHNSSIKQNATKCIADIITKESQRRL